MKRLLALLAIVSLCGCSELSPKEQRRLIDECHHYRLGYQETYSVWSGGIVAVHCWPDDKS